MAHQTQADTQELAQISNSQTETTKKRRAWFTLHDRAPFTLQDKLFLFASLMLLTCYFLPWMGEESPWNVLASNSSASFLLFFVGFFILLLLTPLSVSAPRARPWFGIVAALATGTALIRFGAQSDGGAYGAQLAKVFALAVLVLSAKDGAAKAGDVAMRRLNSRTAEVFSHWGTVLPGIHFSAQELYRKIEQTIRDRQWPGVEFLRVVHTEAGILSHKREYLRVIRQRQVFDVCAASFGKDYFFTLREAEIRAQLTVATLIIFLVALAMLFGFSLSVFGLISGAVNFFILLGVGILVLFNVLRMGLTRLDGTLMRLPVIGPIYETWFRRSSTYFQLDTRLVFLKLMDDLVKEHVDEETSVKGVRVLSCFEHQPILDGIYRTSERTIKTDDAK